MLVKAIENRDSSLPEQLRGGAHMIEIGRTYVVYAIATWSHRPGLHVAICDGLYRVGGYPVFHPAPLFVVVDGRIPSGWEFRREHGDQPCTWREGFVLSYPEWANDDNHYSALLERDRVAVALFLAKKAAIDQEAVAMLGPQDRTDILFAGHPFDDLVLEMSRHYPVVASQVACQRATCGLLFAYRLLTAVLGWVWGTVDGGTEDPGYGEARSILEYIGGRHATAGQPASGFLVEVVATSLASTGRAADQYAGLLDPALALAVGAYLG